MMKKMLLLIVILLLWPQVFIMADEDILSIDDFDLSESREALLNAGYEELDYDMLLEKIMSGNLSDAIKDIGQILYNKTLGNIYQVEKAIGNLLMIIIISSFFTNFANVFSKDNISDTGFYICYLVAVTLMITLFESFCNITSDFVSLLLEFMGGLIPAYFLSIAVMGQATAAGFYQLTLVIIGVVQFIFLNILIPLIKVYLAISLVNNISKEDLLSKTAQGISNLIKFINKSMVGIVTGLNIIQGLILPAVDTAKNTAIKKVIGSLPVIGDGADAMTGILFGSVNLIKNVIGVFGILIIILLCLVPFLKIQLYSVSIQIAAALVQPVADRRITESLECLCMGTKMLTKVIISAGILFIISIAIICMVTNIDQMGN